MATTIIAGNATNGLALTPDNTGILELKTGTGAGTTALTLNASQNATLAGTLTVGSTLQVAGVTTNMYPLVSGTAVTASGTSVDFTSIPNWVRRITVMLSGVSTNGTSILLIQLGDSGGVETTGYSGSTQYAASYVAFSSYAGIPIDTASTVAAGTARSGVLTLSLLDTTTNTWAINGGFAIGTAAALILPAGIKATSATLDRVRITTVNGTDTFDAGSINIIYE